MRVWWRLVGILSLCWVITPATASELMAVRLSDQADRTRLVLEFLRLPDYRVETGASPEQQRLVLPGVVSRVPLPRWPAAQGRLTALSYVTEPQPEVVLTRAPGTVLTVFTLPAQGRTLPRLVIDVTGVPTTAPVATTPVPTPPPPPTTRPVPLPSGVRPVVISIDAGHGGQDPGAIGPSGHYEKHITLAIARGVAAYLNAQPGVVARLTRDTDVFIPLPQRRRIARHEHHADIFISVHADSALNARARGASVYALSLQGNNSATSTFARQLADKENQSDLIGGVAPEADGLSGMLAELLMAGTLKHSLEMGNIILRYLEPAAGRLHSRTVHQAGFAVLREPGMVSLLVETGFLSNPEEEQQLIDPQHQAQLSAAIGEGIVRFLRTYPIPGTLFQRPGN